MELRRHSTAQRFIPLIIFWLAALRVLAPYPLLTEEELKFVVNGNLTPDSILLMIVAVIAAVYILSLHTLYCEGSDLMLAFNFGSQLSQRAAGTSLGINTSFLNQNEC